MPIFQPPTIDDVPPVIDGPYPWPTGPIEYRLFGHYRNRPRGRTVILKTDGTCVGPLDWPAQLVSQDNDTFSVFVEQGLAGVPYTDIARVFTGGHIYYVTDAEAAQLLACGGYVVETCGWGICPYGEGFYGG